MVKPDGAIVSFGLGYVTIVKENGELWVWGIGLNPSINTNPNYNSQKIDHIANDEQKVMGKCPPA